jgi:hypothetical protein
LRAIEAVGTVQEDGTMLVPTPADIEPGQHKVIVVVDQPAGPRERRPRLTWGRYNVELVDPSMTFRREDI